MKRNDIIIYNHRQIISFTVKCVRTTDKAIGFFTEADGITRWIPKSALVEPEFYEPGNRYMIHMYLWRLKKRDGTYPDWAIAQVGAA